jgi:hypothetical protein
LNGPEIDGTRNIRAFYQVKPPKLQHCLLVYQQLVEHRFQKTKQFAGGIADWEDAGYPLEGDRV